MRSPVGAINVADQDYGIGRGLTVPNKIEQEFIVSYLSEEVDKTRALTTEAVRVIELLKERRTALISAAVTGKIGVRNTVAEQVAA